MRGASPGLALDVSVSPYSSCALISLVFEAARWLFPAAQRREPGWITKAKLPVLGTSRDIQVLSSALEKVLKGLADFALKVKLSCPLLLLAPV